MSSYPNTKAWYCSSARYAAVTAWATGQSKTVGNLVRQSAAPSRGNERVFVCITGGTTHASTEPTWTVTRGAKQATDNGVLWQEATGIAALNGDLTNTTNWADMHAIGTGVALGHVCKDAAGTHIFICTTAGTIGGSEPSWSTGTLGNTTADNTATWTYIGTSFGNWAAPHDRLDAMVADTWGGQAGTQTETGSLFFVGDDHAETGSGNITTNANVGGKDGTKPARIICVDHAGSVPPVTADIKSTATITNTGSTTYAFGGIFYMYGITLVGASSGNTTAIDHNNDGRAKVFDTCNFQIGSGAGSGAIMGPQSNSAYTEMINCTVKFSNTGQRFSSTGRVVWRDGGSVDSGGSNPAKLLLLGGRGEITIRGVDLSALSGSTLVDPNSSTLFQNVTVEDCKLPASFTFVTTANLNTPGICRCRMARCDSGAHIYRNEIVDAYGTQQVDASVGRTGGSDIAWKLTTLTLASLAQPFYSMPFAKYNTTLSPTTVTATVYGIINAAAVPNNDEFAMDLNYPGASTNPESSVSHGGIANLLTSTSNAALTADSTSAWDALATARANTHAYVVGDIIKLGTNVGRLFFCTGAGTSSGSEPGGYASAADGGTVTDGGATFRAGCRFKMALTITAQLAGPIRAMIRAMKASTTTYVDPFLDLS